MYRIGRVIVVVMVKAMAKATSAATARAVVIAKGIEAIIGIFSHEDSIGSTNCNNDESSQGSAGVQVQRLSGVHCFGHPALKCTGNPFYLLF